MPSAQRMSSVVKPCCSGNGLSSVFTTPPRSCSCGGHRYALNFKKPVAIWLAFDHSGYRGLTTGAPPGVRQLPIRRLVPRINQASSRVPDAVQCACAAPQIRDPWAYGGMWIPDQQRTTPPARRAALHPRGTTSRTDRITDSRGAAWPGHRSEWCELSRLSRKSRMRKKAGLVKSPA